MKSLKLKKRILSNERGQGAIEYILLLVVIVAIATIFKDQIKGAVEERTRALGDQLKAFNG